MSKGQEIVSVKALLSREDYQNRFKEILGQRAAQFSASVVNISRDKNIAECDPASVIAAAIVAATLDLPVDRNLGFAWIVPYKEKGNPVAQFQVGYKGYVQLALRTGQYERMNAAPINAEAYGGRDSVGEPVILWDKVDVTKPAIGYVFAWKLTSGFTKVCYWTKARVEAHAKQYSQSYRGGYNSPWKTHFEQMAIKTVIKNELSDWGILSIEMQKALRHDQGTQVDIESEVVYTDNVAIPAESTVKPADVSDMATPAKAATTPPTPAAEAKAAAKKEGEDGDLGPVCAHCGQPMTAEHSCPGLQAAIDKAKQTTAKAKADPEEQPKAPAAPAKEPEPQEPTGTPAEQEAAEAQERKDLLASIGVVIEQNEITLPELMAYLEKNHMLNKGQKLTDAATRKLKAINKSIQLPATIAEIKKVSSK